MSAIPLSSLRSGAAVAALVLLAGCAAPPAEPARAPVTSPYPPTATVEFLDEAPTRPYVEIGPLDAPGEPGMLRAQVLAQLREKARALGADAVIVKDVSYRAPATQRLNPTTGYYETVGGQTVPAFKGIAIKFR